MCPSCSTVPVRWDAGGRSALSTGQDNQPQPQEPRLTLVRPLPQGAAGKILQSSKRQEREDSWARMGPRKRALDRKYADRKSRSSQGQVKVRQPRIWVRPSHESQPAPGKAQQGSLPPSACVTLRGPSAHGRPGREEMLRSCQRPLTPPARCRAHPSLGGARIPACPLRILPSPPDLAPQVPAFCMSIGRNPLLASPPGSPPPAGPRRGFSATFTTKLPGRP